MSQEDKWCQLIHFFQREKTTTRRPTSVLPPDIRESVCSVWPSVGGSPHRHGEGAAQGIRTPGLCKYTPSSTTNDQQYDNSSFFPLNQTVGAHRRSTAVLTEFSLLHYPHPPPTPCPPHTKHGGGDAAYPASLETSVEGLRPYLTVRSREDTFTPSWTFASSLDRWDALLSKHPTNAWVTHSIRSTDADQYPRYICHTRTLTSTVPRGIWSIVTPGESATFTWLPGVRCPMNFPMADQFAMATQRVMTTAAASSS